MGKKKRKTAISGGKQQQEERGWKVVDEDGRSVYLQSHPEGVTKTQAESLARNHATPVRVVQINS